METDLNTLIDCTDGYWPAEMLEEGYFFRGKARCYFIVVDSKNSNVTATVCILDTNDVIPKYSGFESLRNGQKILLLNQGEDIIKMDIGGKYFLPVFTNEKNQWYHPDDHRDYIKDFCEVFQFAYDKAMEVSKLQTY